MSRPDGLLSLTTDFGLAEPFAGVMKGVILRRLPGARLIDLSHEMPPHRPDIAGFWLGRAWPWLPEGSVHLAVVDPGVGSTRGVALAECCGSLFLAPHNGLLCEALRHRDARFRIMHPGLPERLGLDVPSATFHGRDLFAPLAAELAAGRLPPAEFGAEGRPRDPAPLPAPEDHGHVLEGRVLVVDRFGNLVTNLPGDALARFRQPAVSAGRTLAPLVRSYADGPAAQAIALVNAWGLVEIAVKNRRADEFLSLSAGSPVNLRDGAAA
jgi:S-adenosylmethionine hydrolase